MARSILRSLSLVAPFLFGAPVGIATLSSTRRAAVPARRRGQVRPIAGKGRGLGHKQNLSPWAIPALAAVPARLGGAACPWLVASDSPLREAKPGIVTIASENLDAGAEFQYDDSCRSQVSPVTAQPSFAPRPISAVTLCMVRLTKVRNSRPGQRPRTAIIPC